MPRFRKKPVVIEAIQFGGETRRGEAWSWACERAGERSVKAGTDERGHFMVIETLEGDMRANEDDWIICGVEGELYPCKAKIFTETYEEVKAGDMDPNGS